MPETALAVPKNSSHNVPATIEAAKTRLTDLARLYLVTEVAGQSRAALDAKRGDLRRFLAFYHQLYGHDHPEEWFVSVTKAFLKQLRGQCLGQASLLRIYATVRHFARWLDRKFPDLFPLGCPTEGIKLPAEPKAHRKGLTRLEELRLLNAARTQIAGEPTGETSDGRLGHGVDAATRERHAVGVDAAESACLSEARSRSRRCVSHAGMSRASCS